MGVPLEPHGPTGTGAPRTVHEPLVWFEHQPAPLRRSGSAWVESTGSIPLRRWSHVAATYDGATARFYINGQPARAAALTHAGNNATNSLSLGGQRDQVNIADLFAGG